MPKSWLISRVGSLLLALPLEHVVEVMRVPPVETLAGALACVRGVSIIRGLPLPVIDAGLLLSADAAPAERLISLRTAARRFALLVGSVVGVRHFSPEALGEPPPLLRHVAADVISAIGLLDAELVFFLGTTLVVPEALLEPPSEAGRAA